MPEHIEDGPCQCWGCIQAIETRNIAISALTLLCEDRTRVDLVALGEKPPVEFSLIDQLRGAAESVGKEGASVGASRGSGLPLDPVAMEMYSTLRQDLHFDAVLAGAISVYDEPEPVANARALVNKLPAIEDMEWVGKRAQSWKKWTQRIREYLNPTRRTPIPGLCPNPECRSEFWFTYDDEGAMVKDHALRAVWVGDEVDGVECSCCFEFWPRRDLHLLASELDPQLFLRLRAGLV